MSATIGSGRRWLRTAGAAAVLFAALPVGAAAAAPATPTASPASGAAGSGTVPSAEPKPVDFAIVVDESGSITPADMTNEISAASLLSQSELSPESRAMVIGFGSSNGPGQSPVDEVCSLTSLDTAGRQRLSSCVGQLHSRTAAQGNDTDIPAALQQAVTRLGQGADTDRPRIVFLLTDGKVDVPDSPQYGPAGERTSAAENSLRQSVLPLARRSGVQIWPLGFGSGVNDDTLKEIAAGGLQSRCADRPDAAPAATRVADSAAVTRALQEAFAAARCYQVTTPHSGVPPTDLFVDIPPIATNGTISVVKHDPRVLVRYFDPNGKEVPHSGQFDGSTFDLSGQNGPVEGLRIVDPRPGRWRVNLTTPTGGGGQPVTTSALWQGVLRSSISLNPPSPVAGERTAVEVQLQTRRGVVIVDPADLAGIHVAVRFTGTGFNPVELPLADDGRAPDARAGDGLFGGYLTVPAAATGSLALLGDVTARGITGDERTYFSTLSSAPSKVTATPTLDDRQTYVGGSVKGTLLAHNDDNKPHTIALSLADVPASQPTTISPESVQVPAGAQQQVRFSVTFGSGAPPGNATGRVVATDITDGNRALANPIFTVNLRTPPSWIWRHRWEVIGGLIVLAAAILLLLDRHRKVRKARDPDGLSLQLLREETVIGHWQVRGPHPDGFGFVVTGEGARMTFREQLSGSRYVLFRDNGGALLRLPTGSSTQVKIGSPVGLGSGPTLVVQDQNPRRRSRPDQSRRTGRDGTPSRGAARRGGGTESRNPAREGAGSLQTQERVTHDHPDM